MDDLGNRDGNQTLRDDGTVNFTVDDDTNRYTAIGGNNISHDDAGNLTVDKDGYQYSYDYENRIVLIEDVNDVTVATYAYDALGRRIHKVDSVASETTLYYYNPEWQVLAEFSGAGVQQRYYMYGNYIDEALVMNDGTDDFYYAHDHLYSVVALLEADGDVVERYEYDAYGKMTRLDPDFTTWSGTEAGNPYYFTGRRLDVLDSDNLEVMYYRHRYYDAYAGRFLQHDPRGINPAGGLTNRSGVQNQYADGINVYQYTRGNVILFTDPFGLAAYVFLYDSHDPMFKTWATATKNKITGKKNTYYKATLNFDPKKDTVHMIPVKGPDSLNELNGIKEIAYLGSFGHGGDGKIWWDYDTGETGENTAVRSVVTGIPGYRLNRPQLADKVDFSLLAKLDYTCYPVIEFYHCYTAKSFRRGSSWTLEFEDSKTTIPEAPAKGTVGVSIISYFKFLYLVHGGRNYFIGGAKGGIDNGRVFSRGWPNIHEPKHKHRQ